MTVPLLTRWMLVFEEPSSELLWLAKGTPRSWLEDGQIISVSKAPTRWGSLSFTVRSHIASGRVEASVDLPSMPRTARIKLRLRVPEGHRIRSVSIEGKTWEQFEAAEESVTLPPNVKGRINLSVSY